jgi:hypothetical protein
VKRRDFLKKGTAAAGLAGSTALLPPPAAAQSGAAKPAQAAAKATAAPEEIRSADYLRCVRQDEFLPKPPVFRGAVSPAGVEFSPMTQADRVARKIVPRRGICSIAPASDALLISGNGAMSVETACDPYSDQVVFRHESLFTPHKRPFEAPNIASIFPQVRQMLLDGKYHDAARLGWIEALPALPASLVKGSISGMLLRSYARLDKLAWDMEARTVDLTVTSVRKQDVTLIARHGIEAITAPAGVLATPLQAGRANIDVHLPENKPVSLHLKLGRRKPLEWVDRAARA